MRLALTLLTIFLLALHSTPHAQAGAIRASADAERDLRQTIQARKLLQEDPELRSLNIGVSVKDRVATLFGPVPSAEAVFRAELNVRMLIGIVDVRNELFVSDLLVPTEPRTRPAPPRPLLPESAPPKLPIQPRSIFSAPAVRLGQTTSRMPIGQKTSSVKLAAPQQVDAAERDLEAQLRVFMNSKSAYQRIRFAIRARHVYLQADETDAEARQEAAQAIARFPGVAGVILVDQTPSR